MCVLYAPSMRGRTDEAEEKECGPNERERADARTANRREISSQERTLRVHLCPGERFLVQRPAHSDSTADGKCRRKGPHFSSRYGGQTLVWTSSVLDAPFSSAHQTCTNTSIGNNCNRDFITVNSIGSMNSVCV